MLALVSPLRRNLAATLAASIASLASVGPACSSDGGDVSPEVEPPARALPEGFRLGVATSAHQIEGGQDNTWTAWEALKLGTETVVELSGVAVDHWSRYEEDYDLAASFGVDVWRLSAEWSRVEPEEGSWDEAAIAHYSAMLDGLRDRGLEPSMTLHHFTEPTWFVGLPGSWGCDPATAACGWQDPESVQRFAGFCALAAERWGDRVDEWWTFNELQGFWLGGFVFGDFPPGLGAGTDAEMADHAMPVLRHLLAAHAACYDAIHAADLVDADSDGASARVGFTIGTGNAYPADPDSEADVAAVERGLYLATWHALDALVGGQLDADLNATPEEAHPEWADRVDLIGLQYYASVWLVGVELSLHPLLGASAPCVPLDEELLDQLLIEAGCPPSPGDDHPFDDVSDPQLPGRYHDPAGLPEVIAGLAGRYPGLPVVITEHGYANHDVKRAGSLVRHLEASLDATDAGLPLEGYYHWSALDNFEWGRGYDVRFGLVRVEREQDHLRVPTVAAEVLSEIGAARGLTQAHLDAWGGAGPLRTELPVP